MNAIKPRSGFTLTEILIVMGLIILLIALAVPAFNLISGSRSVDAGENLVAAMLSRARAEAVKNHRIAGVGFFRDSNTDRSAMVLVVPAADRAGVSDEPAGLEEYKSWQMADENGNATQYQIGDVVVFLFTSPNVPNKRMTQMFVCTQAHTSSIATVPATAGTNPNAPYWGTLNANEIDSLAGEEFQFLPTGVGVQTINDPDPTNTGVLKDRYLRSGVILFDGDGNLVHQQYRIMPPPVADVDLTHLYRLMSFDRRTILPAQNGQPVGANVAFPLFSQMGVILYDEQNFRTNGGTQEDPTCDNQNFATPAYNEVVEETWLDQNCLSLMVNRYNGTLIRGE